ncbi:MAG: M13 family metallopeptidase [Bacteroidaceae bacterium]|nr:M13 family metallopeptidase [Bacteroidaceae bacterium]
MKKNVLALVTMGMLAMGCNQKGVKTMTSGIDLANMDTTMAPGTDFYRYACGGWIDAHPLPNEYARYGSFEALDELSVEQVKTLLNELAAQQHEEGSVGQKIGTLYNVVMDSAKQNAEGIEPLKADLARVASIKSREEIQEVLFDMHLKGMGSMFSFYVGADSKDSKNNIVSVGQGGLSLGDREYYTDTDETTLNIREKFKTHLMKMFTLFGNTEADAKRKMQDVMDVETRLAKKFKSATEMRDPEANYKKMTYDEVKALCPDINWDKFFATMGITDLKYLDFGHPDQLKEINDVLATVPVEQLKSLLEWKTIRSASNYLSDEVRDAQFEFFGKVISGRQEQQPRWKRAIGVVNGSLGEAVGEMYVKKYFPAEAKERMINLVKNLQVALGERIMAQDWMSDSTKAAAIEKLNTFYVKVGYPDKWKDYSSLVIADDSYLANVRRINEWEMRDMVTRNYNKPVDRDEWFITPQTVNAYYNPTTNEICFPAAILQPPFFDMQADDAFNYGGIGVVIGHEMTHGFDDSGRCYDKDGNLRDWWSAEDAERFTARAQVMDDFFANIEILPGLMANGKLTLGENLADHGGLMVAYQALKNATANDPIADKDGFTPEQRFFLAYANLWAGNIREAEMHRRTKSDPHSLGEWRVNGALPHIDAWYEAFGITEEDSMFVPKAERVTIW